MAPVGPGMANASGAAAGVIAGPRTGGTAGCWCAAVELSAASRGILLIFSADGSPEISAATLLLNQESLEPGHCDLPFAQ
jgi:hypothetical protein